MIRFKDEVYKDYYADALTGHIFDNQGKQVEEKTQFQYSYVNIHNKKLRVHCVIAHTFLGYKGKGWNVHHINEDKHDNRLCNLQYLKSGEHTREHFLGKKKPEAFCKKVSESNRRRTLSKETKSKISESNKGKFWLVNKDGMLKYRKECPGPDWQRGRVYKEVI